jgi:hypothetical protein
VSGPGENSQDLKKLREKLAERAVAAVAQAASSGLGRFNRIEVDTFLDPIREHAGFRKLRESLRTASPASGGPPSRGGQNAQEGGR